MTENLLAWFKLDPGEGAFYALFGFVFVFVGIVLLVLFFMLFGFIMKKIGGKKRKAEVRESVVVSAPQEEGISPETVAVISAAIAAYYDAAPRKCDFILRRIRRI